MSGHHYVEDAALIRTAQSAVPPDARAPLKLALERWLSRQRTAPALVGTTRAAEILGSKAPHVARYREQGRMPDPVPVEGSVPAYLREEIEAFGRELEAERRTRRLRAEEGDA